MVGTLGRVQLSCSRGLGRVQLSCSRGPFGDHDAAQGGCQHIYFLLCRCVVYEMEPGLSTTLIRHMHLCCMHTRMSLGDCSGSKM